VRIEVQCPDRIDHCKIRNHAGDVAGATGSSDADEVARARASAAIDVIGRAVSIAATLAGGLLRVIRFN